MIKVILTSMSLIVNLWICDVIAAPRDPAAGSAKIVAKLQSTIKEVTTERDALKTERDAMKADIDKLIAENDQLKTEKTRAAASESRLSSEIAVQQNNVNETKRRLEKTNAKLLEVIDKYNALNKAKADLSNEHGSLKNTQKMTAAELSACENKNLKLYEASKEIVEKYKKRGIVDVLLESEPIFQINTVETETILQEYKDKLNKQKYIKPQK